VIKTSTHLSILYFIVDEGRERERVRERE
jgi:hypothetical protein